jgi:hypothetical protein
MRLRKSGLVGVGACALLAACGASRPPPELAGVWSRGQGACEANVGVVFARDAVRMDLMGAGDSLIARPSYAVERAGERTRVTIRYPLTRRPGGVSARGQGVLVLERGADGWLRPVSHRIRDARTGSVRVRLDGVAPLEEAFTLRRCGDAWIDGLRGRPESGRDV